MVRPMTTDEIISKLAEALDADEVELLLLAKKIPERIKKRVLERPDVFSTLAGLDDRTLDKLLAQAVADRGRRQRRST